MTKRIARTLVTTSCRSAHLETRGSVHVVVDGTGKVLGRSLIAGHLAWRDAARRRGIKGKISPEERLLLVTGGGRGATLAEAMDKLQEMYVLAVLKQCDLNHSEAAHRLGVHRNTVSRIVQRAEIRNPEFIGEKKWAKQVTSHGHPAPGTLSADVASWSTRSTAKSRQTPYAPTAMPRE